MKRTGWHYLGVAALLGLALASGAGATDLALAGILGGKAVLVVDNGPPQLVAEGKSTAEGVKLLAIDGDVAVVEFEGRRHDLRLGARVVRQRSRGADRPGVDGFTNEAARKVLARGVEMVIEANERGEFLTGGEVNGGKVRFLVDTGATFVSIGRSDARRLGIDLEGATPGMSQTAGGNIRVWRVTLGSVKVGSLQFRNVEGVVHDGQDLPFVLLGMSVLKDMEMRRKGSSLYLRRAL
ncbi:MAG: retroviral-like aspartic protease family protein [Azoarcus sp.]|nr:retroviral-like aspartic protease family protein [Azoarcus sp.]